MVIKMEDCCQVCFNTFSEKLVPKSLECGHSLCCTCITALLVKSPYCPQCRRALLNSSASQYPTNFSLINLIESFQKSESEKESINKRKIILMEKYTNTLGLLTEKEKLLKKDINILNEQMSIVKSGILNLNNFSETKFKEMESKKLIELLDYMDMQINAFHIMENRESCSDLKSTFRLNDFKGPYEFLCEIYTRIQNKENMISVELINGKIRCGRIDIYGNRVIFYSLSKQEFQGENITTVLFSDIKQCAKWLKLTPFLKFSCNNKGLEEIALIEATMNPIVAHFIKLCSGELGPTYKGSSYYQWTNDKPLEYKGILRVKDYILNGQKVNGQIDYISGFQNKISCLKGELIIYGSLNGGFGISKLTCDTLYQNTIGKIIQPCYLRETISFSDTDTNKIIDCGISFTL